MFSPHLNRLFFTVVNWFPIFLETGIPQISPDVSFWSLLMNLEEPLGFWAIKSDEKFFINFNFFYYMSRFCSTFFKSNIKQGYLYCFQIAVSRVKSSWTLLNNPLFWCHWWRSWEEQSSLSLNGKNSELLWKIQRYSLNLVMPLVLLLPNMCKTLLDVCLNLWCIVCKF